MVRAGRVEKVPIYRDAARRGAIDHAGLDEGREGIFAFRQGGINHRDFEKFGWLAARANGVDRGGELRGPVKASRRENHEHDGDQERARSENRAALRERRDEPAGAFGGFSVESGPGQGCGGFMLIGHDLAALAQEIAPGEESEPNGKRDAESPPNQKKFTIIGAASIGDQRGGNPCAQADKEKPGQDEHAGGGGDEHTFHTFAEEREPESEPFQRPQIEQERADGGHIS
jgi:hypothetical protein